MPMYEYRCASCGHLFEELVFRPSDEKELKCPACGAEELERMMSAFSSSNKDGSSGSKCSAPSGFS